MRALIAGGWVYVMAAVLAACGGDSGPSDSPLTIAKTDANNGDGQTAPAGQSLPVQLRVIVTRNGDPVAGSTVTWAAGAGGSVAPATDQTDDSGISTTTWTLGITPGSQGATATLPNATNSPLTFTATATSTSSGPVIQVISANTGGDNRFEPVTLTVQVGSTVTWEWVDAGATHNVVPDDGVTPASSGDLAHAPHSYSYTFNQVGTFAYHCASHGAAGGIGMSGTVRVVSGGGA